MLSSPQKRRSRRSYSNYNHILIDREQSHHMAPIYHLDQSNQPRGQPSEHWMLDTDYLDQSGIHARYSQPTF